MASVESAGEGYDDALCERFYATLETELIDRSALRTDQETRAAVFDPVVGLRRRHRRHSALGYLSPAGFERRVCEGTEEARVA